MAAVQKHVIGVKHVLNTLRPRQNGRHFPDDNFECIFFNETVWISIKISLKFVPTGLINNIPALVQIMAWRRPGDKPLPDQWWLCYWRIYASLGLNKLKRITYLTTHTHALRCCSAWGDNPSSQAIRGVRNGGSALLFRQRIIIVSIVPKAVHSRGPHCSGQLRVMPLWNIHFANQRCKFPGRDMLKNVTGSDVATETESSKIGNY